MLAYGADPNLRVYNDIGDPGSQLRPVLAEYLASNVNPDAEVISLLLKHGARVNFYIPVTFINNRWKIELLIIVINF